jgi:heme exporter protein D
MILSPAFIVILLVLMCATPIFARRVLLRPVFRAGEGQRTFAKFTVADIASLTAYFAIAAGLTTIIADLLDERLANYIVAVSFFYALGTWYLGVQSLDSAGVRDPRRRLVYLSLAVPAAYAGSMTIAVIGVFAVWFRYFETRRYMRPEALVGDYAWVVWTVFAILVLSLVLARQIAGWVVRAPQPPAEQP